MDCRRGAVISVIIPAYNEERALPATLDRLLRQPGECEIILVDGGSSDRTRDIAKAEPRIRQLSAPKGRASQMNAGARVASGEWLLFLHADTQLPPNFRELIVTTLKHPQVVAGAFELAIDGRERSLRWVEILVKLRSHLLSLPYGDQGIFISKQAFLTSGGFANIPIMEDFEFIQRLKQQGHIAIAPGTVTTSGRRWQKLGVWQTTLINQLVIAGYYLGISPRKLRDFYPNCDRKCR